MIKRHTLVLVYVLIGQLSSKWPVSSSFTAKPRHCFIIIIGPFRAIGRIRPNYAIVYNILNLLYIIAIYCSILYSVCPSVGPSIRLYVCMCVCESVLCPFLYPSACPSAWTLSLCVCLSVLCLCVCLSVLCLCVCR